VDTTKTMAAASPVARAREIVAAGLPEAIKRHKTPTIGLFPVYSPFEL